MRNLHIYIISLVLGVALVGFSFMILPKQSDQTVIMNEAQIVAQKLQNQPTNIDIEVKSGDSFASILSEQGIQSNEIDTIIQSVKKVFDPGKLAVGQEIKIAFDPNSVQENSESKVIKSIEVKTDVDKTVTIANYSGNYKAKEEQITLSKKIVRVGAEVTSSLSDTAQRLEIPYASFNELVKALSYEVDFQREIKFGNKFDVFFERFYKPDGSYSHDGNIVFAALDLGGRQIEVYRYVDAKGNVEYYDQSGHSMKRDLLKTPMNAIKISSGFGNRKHPILGYTKMHKGVDFAAAHGTPIFAAGKGVVEEMGQKGAYGNYIKIKHSGEYSTAYAHVSKFASKLKKGAAVKQGQVIAYVGATGRVTGAHLHYEVLAHGKHVNPMSVKLRPATQLAKAEQGKFLAYAKEVKALSINTPYQTELAYENFSSKLKEQL